MPSGLRICYNLLSSEGIECLRRGFASSCVNNSVDNAQEYFKEDDDPFVKTIRILLTLYSCVFCCCYCFVTHFPPPPPPPTFFDQSGTNETKK